MKHRSLETLAIHPHASLPFITAAVCINRTYEGKISAFRLSVNRSHLRKLSNQAILSNTLIRSGTRAACVVTVKHYHTFTRELHTSNSCTHI